jgi:hypothetical protein
MELDMEMKLVASGVGASVPKLGVGFSLFSGIYILIRHSATAKPYVFGVATGPEIGGNNGSLVASYINTSWMKLNPLKHDWLCSGRSLVGKLAEIELKGTLLFSGDVDISISIYDDSNESIYELSKIKIESSGGQLTDTKIRGKIVDMMGKTKDGTNLCAQP